MQNLPGMHLPDGLSKVDETCLCESWHKVIIILSCPQIVFGYPCFENGRQNTKKKGILV